jgi:rhodanese-related sulfurtransferase
MEAFMAEAAGTARLGASRRRAAALSLCGAALAAAVAIAGGCGAPKTSDKDLAFVDVTDAVELVQPKREFLGGTRRGVWVDPRSGWEFSGGHIAGAVNLPLEKARADYGNLAEYDVVIVYGESYDDPLALAMSKTLIELGLADVRTLRGGLRAWTEDGRPLEKSSP